MHVITRKRLQEFWQTYPDAERPLRSWLAVVRLKRYARPNEVRQDFPSASFLGKWRTVFNIDAFVKSPRRGCGVVIKPGTLVPGTRNYKELSPLGRSKLVARNMVVNPTDIVHHIRCDFCRGAR